MTAWFPFRDTPRDAVSVNTRRGRVQRLSCKKGRVCSGTPPCPCWDITVDEGGASAAALDASRRTDASMLDAAGAPLDRWERLHHIGTARFWLDRPPLFDVDGDIT
jgi:hypothetical protein